VKKYVKLTLRREVESDVVAFVDTDLDAEALERAEYTPAGEFSDSPDPWDAFLLDNIGRDGPDFRLEDVRPMERVDEDDIRNAEPFVAVAEEEEEGGAK
jgi:hypothetical protein